MESSKGVHQIIDKCSPNNNIDVSLDVKPNNCNNDNHGFSEKQNNKRKRKHNHNKSRNKKLNNNNEQTEQKQEQQQLLITIFPKIQSNTSSTETAETPVISLNQEFLYFSPTVPYDKLLNKWNLSSFKEVVGFNYYKKFWLKTPWQLRSIIGTNKSTLGHLSQLFPAVKFTLKLVQPHDCLGWPLSLDNVGHVQLKGPIENRKSAVAYMCKLLTNVRNRQIQNIDLICNPIMNEIMMLNSEVLHKFEWHIDSHHPLYKTSWNLPQFQNLHFCEGYNGIRLIFLPELWQQCLIDGLVYQSMNEGRSLFEDLSNNSTVKILGLHNPLIDDECNCMCFSHLTITNNDNDTYNSIESEENLQEENQETIVSSRVCMHIAIQSNDQFEIQWATQWINRQMYLYWNYQVALLRNIFPDILQEVCISQLTTK